MNNNHSSFYNIEKSSKIILLLFSLFVFNISAFSRSIIDADTIRIDGRLVVVNKQEVDTLKDIPQEELKEKLGIQKYVITNLGWAISNNTIESTEEGYDLVDDFVGTSKNLAFNNFSAEVLFGIQTKTNWLLEVGLEVSSFSFITQQFNISDLNDSTINNITDHTFDGFEVENNSLIQLYREYFGIGWEPREVEMKLTDNTNRLTYLTVPVYIGKTWELNDNLWFVAKGGFLNSFLIQSDIKSQYLINETNTYKVDEQLNFNKYISKISIQPGFTYFSDSKLKNIYIGLNLDLPLSDYSESGASVQVSRIGIGVKAGVRFNLF